ncbi:MAG: DUF4214 domain-containing protein [Desulfobacterales bacterium]|nr:DUF4214 domain-containing protein [Desulfobacterales bacterium]
MKPNKNFITITILFFIIILGYASSGMSYKIIYTYDTLDRLTKVDYGYGKYISYGYDESGNITQVIQEKGQSSTIETNESFVQQQYRDFFNREGETSGVAYWAAALASGQVYRDQLVQIFFESAEFQVRSQPAARLYLAYFNRIPSYSDLQGWISQYATGTSLYDISQTFASTQEFQNQYGNLDNTEFAQLVYTNVLQRTPDTDGFNYWVDRLNNGYSRANMMACFAESGEYKNLSRNKLKVIMLYTAMLRREPDQSGYEYWVNNLVSGVSVINFINGFLTSTEYTNRIYSL